MMIARSRGRARRLSRCHRDCLGRSPAGDPAFRSHRQPGLRRAGAGCGADADAARGRAFRPATGRPTTGRGLDQVDGSTVTLRYSAPWLPGGASLNAETGWFEWTPAFSQRTGHLAMLSHNGRCVNTRPDPCFCLLLWLPCLVPRASRNHSALSPTLIMPLSISLHFRIFTLILSET